MARFGWHELQTRDRARAAAFYGALLGWKTSEVEGGDVLCARDGGGAVAAITTSKAPPHVPAYWMPYLVVDDVDATTNAAAANGARVLRSPSETRGVRSSAVVDPRGAIFGVRAKGAEQTRGEGAFSWNEILTDDASTSAAFYAKLLACEVEEIALGPAATYRVLRRGDERIAGVMKHPEDVHPHWLHYVTVRDVDAATKRAVELGGSIYVPAIDVPGFGRFSGIDDPTGAGICLRAYPRT